MMSGVGRCRAAVCSAIGGLSLLLLSHAAHADPSPTEKAAAEALFQKGVELMAAGKTADACDKFSGSQELDPALGTVLRLADCYERMDKTASAWALFEQAAAMARTQNQPDRVKIASERAQSVEQRLSKLEVAVHPAMKTGQLQITLNGVAIPPGTWDAALPVDPGSVTVAASAPGYEPFKTTIDVARGPSSVRVQIPELRPAATPVEAATPVTAAVPPPPTQKGSNGAKIAGYTLGGVGLAGLALGGIFAYLAHDKNQDSLDQCRQGAPNECTQEGVALREDAQSNATIATVATIAGGALLATGITVLVLAPSSKEASASAPGFRARAQVTPTGLRLSGEF